MRGPCWLPLALAGSAAAALFVWLRNQLRDGEAWARARLVAEKLIKARLADEPAPVDGEALKLQTREDSGLCQEAMMLAPGGLGQCVGWKIGATNAAIQMLFGVTEPIAAPIFSNFTHVLGCSSASLDVSHSKVRAEKAEAEFGFIIGQALPARRAPFTEQQVWEAVESIVPAIELVCSRVKKGANLLTILADGGVNACTITGKPRSTGQYSTIQEMINEPVKIIVNGKLAGTGSGADVLGSPLSALTWLANHLASRGLELKAGHVVITGAAVVTPVAQGDAVGVEFGNLGSLQVRML